MAEKSTTVGSTIAISGELRSQEDVAIYGKVLGYIETTADLYVEQGGEIQAEVVTRNIEVWGSVVGNITASGRFQIHPGGSVTGDVRAPSVILADGALYKGRIDMDVPLPAALTQKEK